MKKKVGIITILDEINYGNRLQNYAMEKLFEKLGYEAFTVPHISFQDWFYVRKDKKQYIRQKLYRIRVLVDVVHLLKRKKKVDHIEDEISKYGERKKNFKIFNETELHMEKEVINKEPISNKLSKRYDYFVTGSDQVWNPSYGNAKYVMYLRFAPKRKRIAIAASFGMTNIPNEHTKLVKKYLNGMKYISVREVSGKKIVEKYTGKTCDVLLDPTLLVPIDTWNNLINGNIFSFPEQYMVAYFLGNISEQRKQFVYEVAKIKGLSVVWLNNDDYSEHYSIGPKEFVKALKNAQMVVTDSFHGCVFSILFKKQFVVFKREGYAYEMFDRIETLLNMVDLTSQIKNDYSVEYNTISCKKYTEIENVLIKKRLEAESIIRSVMI